MKVESILQHFWPALINNGSWKTILVFFLSGRLRQVLLYNTTSPLRTEWYMYIFV